MNGDPPKFDFSQSAQMVLFLALFGLFTLLIHNLQSSASGRAMYAVRSSQVAAEASGVSPAERKSTVRIVGRDRGFGGVLFGLSGFTTSNTPHPRSSD